jgi:hypothetical protein
MILDDRQGKTRPIGKDDEGTNPFAVPSKLIWERGVVDGQPSSPE